MRIFIFILSITLFSVNNVFSQTYSSKEQYDLLKYWNLRDRMDLWVKQGYQYIGPNACVPYGTALGYNLVPSHLRIWEEDINSLSGYKLSEKNIDLFRLKFGDGGHYLGWYISVLATEYELIRRNGLEDDNVLEELFNSMETVYRLDVLAENLPPYNHKPTYAGCHPNGYFVRADVRHGMLGTANNGLNWYDLSNIPNQLDEDRPDADADTSSDKDCGDYLGVTPGTATGCSNAMSQDQVAHIFMGLALVKRYLPDQTLNFNGRSYNFHQKAKDFTHAIMRRLHVDGNLVIMPKFDKVATRGGNLSVGAYAFRKAALWIEDKGAKHYCHVVVSNPWNGKKSCPEQVAAASFYYLALPVLAVTPPFTRALNLSVGTIGKTFGSYNPFYLSYCYSFKHEIYQLLHHALHNNSVIFRNKMSDMLQSMDCYGPRQYDNYYQATPLLFFRYNKQNELVSPNDPTKPHPRFSNGTAGGRWQFSDRFNVGTGTVGSANNNRQFVGLDYMLFHNLFAIWMHDTGNLPTKYQFRNYEENDVRAMQYPVGPNSDDWGGKDNPAFEYSFKPLTALNSSSQSGSIVVFESAKIVDAEESDFQGEFDMRVEPFDCANHSGPKIQLNKTGEELPDTIISGNPQSLTFRDLMVEEYGDELDFVMDWIVEHGYLTNAQVDSMLNDQFSDNILQAVVNMAEALQSQNTAEEEPSIETPKISVFPNPFHAGVKFTLELPEAAPVTIKLYTVVGQELKTLAQGEELPAGSHARSFDLSGLPGGAYVCKVWIGGDFQTFKLMKE